MRACCLTSGHGVPWTCLSRRPCGPSRLPPRTRASSKPRPRPATHPGVFFFQAEDGIRDLTVTGVQTCALPISRESEHRRLSVVHQGTGDYTVVIACRIGARCLDGEGTLG